MGGGEGSAAREALRHNSIEKVVMCDIDQVISIVHSPRGSIFIVVHTDPLSLALIVNFILRLYKSSPSHKDSVLFGYRENLRNGRKQKKI